MGALGYFLEVEGVAGQRGGEADFGHLLVGGFRQLFVAEVEVGQGQLAGGAGGIEQRDGRAQRQEHDGEVADGRAVDEVAGHRAHVADGRAAHQFQVLRQAGQQATHQVRFEQMAGRGSRAQHHAARGFVADAAPAGLVENQAHAGLLAQFFEALHQQIGAAAE